MEVVIVSLIWSNELAVSRYLTYCRDTNLRRVKWSTVTLIQAQGK
jgi:hypothetical protein